MTHRDRYNDPFRRKPDPRATVSRHRTRLLAMDGVVSVGLGFDESHRSVIVIGVASGDAPVAQALPQELDAVPVEVRVVGALRVEDDRGTSGGTPTA